MGNTDSEHENKQNNQNDVIDQRPVKFNLHIAIDFGSNGCGIAFAYKDKVTIYDKWRSNKQRQRRNKTKTQILLGVNNDVICFGDNAKMMYCEADENTCKSWKFFERFKMALYDRNIKKLNIIDSNEEKKIDEVDTVNELMATNGRKCESEIVFVLSFKHIQELAKRYIYKITTSDIKDEEIQWILTVPAIWSENAKYKMKEWIIKAGLVDKTIRDQCLIVYEPDCAALAIQKEFFAKHIKNKSFNLPMLTNPNDDSDDDDDDDDEDNKDTDNMKIDSFAAGDKYILIDAGGGTVDIACHEILDDGAVEEIVYPTGDKWGSCYIDDLYIKLLETIFSKEWIDEYKNKTPGKYVEIIEYFQFAKCEFYQQSQVKTHDVQLPYEFLQFLEEKCISLNTKPEAIIKQFRKPVSYYQQLFNNVRIDDDDDDDEDIKQDADDLCNLTQVTVTSNRRNRNDEEYIEIDIVIWKCLFDSMINNIVNHVNNLLNMDILTDKCKYLCLVGGFSASLYFQEKMKQYFGDKSKYNLNVLIPKIPMLSVVEGAAYFGITNKFIKARRLKYTYGIKMFFNKTRARKNGIDEEYIKQNTTSDGMVRDCFKVIARRNDRIGLNEIKSVISFKTSQISLIPILWSNKRNPTIASHGNQESVLKIYHTNSEKEEIVTEFHFYGTIFTVYSYPKNNPNDKQKVNINYNKFEPKKKVLSVVANNPQTQVQYVPDHYFV